MRCPPHPCPRRQVVVPKGRRRLVREGGGAQDRCVVRAQCLWQDDRLGRTLGDITQVPQRIAQSLPRGREGAGRGGAGGGGWEGAGQGMAERDGLRFDVVQSHAPPPPSLCSIIRFGCRGRCCRCCCCCWSARRRRGCCEGRLPLGPLPGTDEHRRHPRTDPRRQARPAPSAGDRDPQHA